MMRSQWINVTVVQMRRRIESMSARGHKRRIVDGVLPLDKPPGMTSNRILQRVKWMYQARKAGHTGSLDPLASGMLPICFGQATKLSAYLLAADKLYQVTARFGVKTDTADADGQMIAESELVEVGRDVLEAALGKFRGEIQQIPPMYSALKKDGKRLYEYAREGKEVRRDPRTVHIHDLEIDAYDPREPAFQVRCSKGTYIRTLVEDIAESVGTVAHVIALRRLAVFPFRASDLVRIEDLEEAALESGFDQLDAYLRPVDEVIADWPAVYLNREESSYVRQGHPVNNRPVPESGLVRLYDEGRLFMGIGEAFLDGRIAPKRLFVDTAGSRVLSP
jgi:tRNA pseudouridine55 synthase